MTKLTDINGAREALPITHHDFKGEGWFCNNDLSNVHLEVDVEAIEQICRESVLIDPKDWCSLASKAIALNPDKWARLVRK